MVLKYSSGLLYVSFLALTAASCATKPNIAEHPAETKVGASTENPLASRDTVPLPVHPDECIQGLKVVQEEFVDLTFDINENGRAESIDIFFSSDNCYESDARKLLSQQDFSHALARKGERSRQDQRIRIMYRSGGHGKRREYHIEEDLLSMKTVLALRMAMTLRSNHDYGNALEVLDDALTDASDLTEYELATLYELRGSVRLKSKDYDGALDDYARAVDLSAFPPNRMAEMQWIISELRK